ncbi:MAG: ABC transporter ATP-binding protein [Clostridiales Family XIII bacterium]|jgi:energy-coupling factor transport system ATP-binding protein|nr:ABC transporter ATP-binding protein [Clostridiales Family XIII bacterium]
MTTDRARAVISFSDFGFQYRSQAEPTLFEISLDVKKGEKILIVGPSGSGKSTLGHCLNGLIPFSYKGKAVGSLIVDGLETKAQTIFEMSKHVGTVLQDSDGQFVGLTVGEDIAFALENEETPIEEMREKVLRAARMTGMEPFLRSSPFELSGGQKQRTSLAGVLVEDADILLFDEPLANLDPATGKTAIEIIDDIHRQYGKTIIIIEHRLEDVLHRHVDRVIVVNDGRIVADMSADRLVCSDALSQNGIREPLYITALKYAGAVVTPDIRPGRIETLDISAAREPLRRWFEGIREETPRPATKAVLRVEGLSFSYEPGKEVLRDIGFEIAEGEMVSVVGRNGAGKSTLTKLLCGFEKPTAGAIYYDGEDIKDHTIKERAGYIGLVMQNPNQMISETMIRAEVGLGLKLRGIAGEEADERIARALRICGLAPFAKWPISALSFGQKKRVTVASMLVLNPRILILDEPTAGQDYRHYTEIMRFLRTLNEEGVTVLLITHDMHLMLEYTPRAIVLSEGELICDAPASRILTDADIIERANLKETSLYALARKAEIADAPGFVQAFIDYENAQRRESESGAERRAEN